jgi:hypothetical protein
MTGFLTLQLHKQFGMLKEIAKIVSMFVSDDAFFIYGIV